MALSPALQTTHDQLVSMDKQIEQAQGALRVAKAANLPGAMKLESDLAKALIQRDEMLKALKNEADR